LGRNFTHSVNFGKEFQNIAKELQAITVETNIDLQAVKDGRLIKLEAARKNEVFGSFSCNYTYLDNILNEANIEIDLNPNKTLKYSAQWVGLKSIIL
jgi:hypothetical protein